MNFWEWRRARELKEPPKAHPDPAEEGAGPCEPIQVQEHNTSTTIIERLYAVLGKRS